VLRC